MMLIDPAEQNSRPRSVGILWLVMAVFAVLISITIVSKENARRDAFEVMLNEYKNWVAYVDTPEQADMLQKFRFCYMDYIDLSVTDSKNYGTWIMLGTKADAYRFFNLANEAKTTCLNEIAQQANLWEVNHPGYLEEFKLFKQELGHRHRWQI